MQIAVRPTPASGNPPYTTLSFRVRINPTPYAIRALSTPWSGITGIPAGFADGIDNDTTYSAGAGLVLTGTTFSIAPGGVVTGMLADLAVTTPKLADGAVTDAKLSNTGATAGTYGSATQVGVFTVNAQGRITSASNVTISGVSPGGAAGGDLSGTYPNPTVARLQGRPVDSTAPTNGQVLKWNGGEWAPAADDVGDLTLPFSGSANVSSGAVFSITNTEPYGSTINFGVQGESRSIIGAGVYGLASAYRNEGYGVYGRNDSPFGTGVYGRNDSPSGIDVGGSGRVGVRGMSASTSGTGVVGWAISTRGITYGVWGESRSTDGRGVYGYASASSGATYGVFGQSDSPSGTGVYGLAISTSGVTYGVFGETKSVSYWVAGVYGYASANSGDTWGVYGRSNSTIGKGMLGYASATSGTTYGVYGTSASPSGYGVYFSNRLAGTGTKSFQMDHPLSPETHYLNHFCAEGPEPYNIYRGTVVLGANGEAWVQLPNYFEAINRDPVITLTPVGSPMPNLHVAVEVQNGRFKIAGGVANKRVFWRVEAIRNDLWVQRYGYQTEQEKPKEHQGKYLHPELYGQPKEKGIHYNPDPEPAPNELPKP